MENASPAIASRDGLSLIVSPDLGNPFETMSLTPTLHTNCLIIIMAIPLLPSGAISAPIPVEVEQTACGHRLLRGGEPYYIKGAGGSTFLEELAQAGGNSVRTWGIEQTGQLLPEINRLGLTVTAGLWIEHERHGFDYDDEAAVRAQIERHKQSVDRIREDPAILIWSIGNEVWINASNLKVWDTIEAVAAYIKEVDPHRPTMTVLPHVSKEEVQAILSRCPSIDILGLNTYGGINVIMAETRKAGWDGPVVIAEWGNNGGWEVPTTPWGAQIEPTSTEKAWQFSKRYTRILENRSCLGSYAFLWGGKQEMTPTWFTLFLEDGTPTAAVDTLQYLWTGAMPEQVAPVITPLRLNGQSARAGPRFKPGQPVEAAFTLVSPDAGQVATSWKCLPESEDKRLGGDKEQKPDPVDLAFDCTGASRARFKAPEQPGAYRLFATITSRDGKSATANIPFLVEPCDPSP
jgi:hypothetical protein